MKEDSAIYCEELHFTYEDGASPILQNVNLEIPRGEFAVLAGPSGTGKSTLCRTFNNVIPLFYRGAISGVRSVGGEVLGTQPISSMARIIGMVFQDFEQQLFSTSALLELAFSLENFGVSRQEMEKRIADLLEKFQLSHLMDREPFSLSGGEKQKLAIASVLVYRPKILVLDEPTTDLDPESRAFVMEILPHLKEWVETILIVDHETDLFHQADRILLLRDGVIQASGPASQILVDSGVLEENSLASLDLVSLQKEMGLPIALRSPQQLAELLPQYRLEPLPSEPRSGSAPVVEVNNLTFRYPGQEVQALHDVSFEIRQGEFVGIIGRNGSGKSTLLKHLNGIQHPQHGSVRILNQEVREWDRMALSRAVGLVFQNPDHQIFNTSVREEVEFGPRQFHFSGDEIRQNSDRAIEIMDLVAQTQSDPFQLSKGERQRVAVASVLSIRPQILILDEPTTGLDRRQQKHLMDLLRELNRTGVTIIIVTHALKIVGDYCDYAVWMQKGEKACEGHPRDVFFHKSIGSNLPPLWELSALLRGNALNRKEFLSCLRKEN